MTHETLNKRSSLRQPLPVTLVPGMRVHDVRDVPAGEVVGITQQFCVYRLADDDRLCVANWRDLALDNICPAAPLLPSDVTVNDRLNASATVLRELLAFQRLAELSPAQHAAMDELLAVLTR